MSRRPSEQIHSVLVTKETGGPDWVCKLSRRGTWLCGRCGEDNFGVFPKVEDVCRCGAKVSRVDTEAPFRRRDLSLEYPF